MATHTPGLQQRSQYHAYWGNYVWNNVGTLPSFGGRTAGAGSQGLPNAPGNIISAVEHAKLEAGDTASTRSFSVPLGVEYGLWTCIFPGTSGGGDAVWVRCDSTLGAVVELEIDFGALPQWEESFVVVDGSVTPTSRVLVWQSGATATGRVGNDQEWDQLLLSANPGVGQLEITAYSMPGPVVGRRIILYQIVG